MKLMLQKLVKKLVLLVQLSTDHLFDVKVHITKKLSHFAANTYAF